MDAITGYYLGEPLSAIEESQREMKLTLDLYNCLRNKKKMSMPLEDMVNQLDSLLNQPRKVNDPLNPVSFAIFRELAKQNPNQAEGTIEWGTDLVELNFARHLAGVRPFLSLKENAIVWRYDSLLSCFWLQMFLDLTGRKKVYCCPACGLYFIAIKRNQVYCSDLCRERMKKRRQRAREREEKKAQGLYRPPGRPPRILQLQKEL
ncbi:MAG TPA: hypothetical protein GXX51_06250 [Firmicutes bacterium]|nr:hypothetical protein [Bacillota bacterium]